MRYLFILLLAPALLAQRPKTVDSPQERAFRDSIEIEVGAEQAEIDAGTRKRFTPIKPTWHNDPEVQAFLEARGLWEKMVDAGIHFVAYSYNAPPYDKTGQGGVLVMFKIKAGTLHSKTRAHGKHQAGHERRGDNWVQVVGPDGQTYSGTLEEALNAYHPPPAPEPAPEVGPPNETFTPTESNP